MIELIGADAYIYQTLAADATIAGAVNARIFADFAPEVDPATGQAPLYPMVVFSLNTSAMTIGPGATRIQSKPLYLVKVVGENVGYGALQPIADRIDALLTQPVPQTVTIGGLTCSVQSYCERQVHYAEAPDKTGGNAYRNLGGVYRLYISSE